MGCILEGRKQAASGEYYNSVCEIEKLDIITWVPGAAHVHKDWTWLYKKIDSLGKGWGMGGVDFEAVKRSWHEYNNRKLSFTISASSRTEAEDFIAELDKRS